MNWIWSGLCISFAIFSLISFLPVTVHIRYIRDGEKDDLQIQVRTLFGLIKYTVHISAAELIIGKSNKSKVNTKVQRGFGEKTKKQTNLPIFFNKILRYMKIQNQLIENLYKFNTKVRQFTRVFQILQFNWKTEFGTGDAALTGAVTGGVWAIKGSIVGVAAHYFKVRNQPVLEVYPSFNQLVLRSDFNCIIRFSVGKAMMAGILFGFYMLREGKKSWQIIRSKV